MTNLVVGSMDTMLNPVQPPEERHVYLSKAKIVERLPSRPTIDMIMAPKKANKAAPRVIYNADGVTSIKAAGATKDFDWLDTFDKPDNEDYGGCNTGKT